MKQVKQDMLDYGISPRMLEDALHPHKARKEAFASARTTPKPRLARTLPSKREQLPRMKKRDVPGVEAAGVRLPPQTKGESKKRARTAAHPSRKTGGFGHGGASPKRRQKLNRRTKARIIDKHDDRSDSDSDELLSKQHSSDSLGIMFGGGGGQERAATANALFSSTSSLSQGSVTLAGAMARKFDDLDERVRAQTAHRKLVNREQQLLQQRAAKLQEEADIAMERYRDSARAVDMAIEREHGSLGVGTVARVGGSETEEKPLSLQYVRDHGVGRGIVGGNIVPVSAQGGAAFPGAKDGGEVPRSSTAAGAADDRKRHALARAQLDSSRKEVLGLLAEHRGRAVAQRSALEAAVRSLASHNEDGEAPVAGANAGRKGYRGDSGQKEGQPVASAAAVARFDARRKQLDDLVEESKAAKEGAAKQLRSLFGECVDALFELEAMASEGRRGLALREELQRVRETMKASAGMVDRLSARARDLGSKLAECRGLLSKQVHSTEAVQSELRHAEEANGELRRALASADARAGRMERQLLEQTDMVSRTEWNEQVERALQAHGRAERAEADVALLQDRLRRIGDAQQAHADARASSRILQLQSQVEGLQERLRAQRDEFATQLKARDDQARGVEDSLQSFLEARLPSRDKVIALLDDYRSRRASLEQILRATGLALQKDPEDGDAFAGVSTDAPNAGSRRNSVHDVVNRVTERMMAKARRRSIAAHPSGSAFGLGRARSMRNLSASAGSLDPEHPKGWVASQMLATTATVQPGGEVAIAEAAREGAAGSETFLTSVPSAPQLLGEAPSAESLASSIRSSASSQRGARPSARLMVQTSGSRGGRRLSTGRRRGSPRDRPQRKKSRSRRAQSRSPKSRDDAIISGAGLQSPSSSIHSSADEVGVYGLASMPELPAAGDIETAEVVVRQLQHQLGGALKTIESLEEELALERRRADDAERAAREEADKDVALERMRLDNTFGRFAREIREVAEQKAIKLERLATGADEASRGTGAEISESDEQSVDGGSVAAASESTAGAATGIMSEEAPHDADSLVQRDAQRAAAHRALEKLVGVESTAIARVAHLSQQLSETQQQLQDEKQRRAAVNSRLMEAEAKWQALDWFNEDAVASSDQGRTELDYQPASEERLVTGGDAASARTAIEARRWKRQLAAAARRGQFREEARRVALQVRAKTAIGTRVKSAVRRAVRHHERKAELAMLLAASVESDAVRAVSASMNARRDRAQTALDRTFLGSRVRARSAHASRNAASADHKLRAAGEVWSPPQNETDRLARNGIEGRGVPDPEEAEVNDGASSAGLLAGSPGIRMEIDILGETSTRGEVEDREDLQITAVDAGDQFDAPLADNRREDPPGEATAIHGKKGIRTPVEKKLAGTKSERSSEGEWTPTYKGRASISGVADVQARAGGVSAPHGIHPRDHSAPRHDGGRPPRAQSHGDHDTPDDPSAYSVKYRRPDTRRSSRGSRGPAGRSADVVDGPAFGRIPEVPSSHHEVVTRTAKLRLTSMQLVSRQKAAQLRFQQQVTTASVAQGVALGLGIARADSHGYFAKPWTRGSVTSLPAGPAIDQQRSVVIGSPREAAFQGYEGESGEQLTFQNTSKTTGRDAEAEVRRQAAMQRLANRRSLLSSSHSLRLPGTGGQQARSLRRPLVRDVGVNTRGSHAMIESPQAIEVRVQRRGRALAANVLLEALRSGSAAVFELIRSVLGQLPQDLLLRHMQLLDRVAAEVLSPPVEYGGGLLASANVPSRQLGSASIDRREPDDDLDQEESVLNLEMSIAMRSAAVRRPTSLNSTAAIPRMRIGHYQTGLAFRPETAAVATAMAGDRIAGTDDSRPSTTVEGLSARGSRLQSGHADIEAESSVYRARSGARSQSGRSMELSSPDHQVAPKPPSTPALPLSGSRPAAPPRPQRKLRQAIPPKQSLFLDPRREVSQDSEKSHASSTAADATDASSLGLLVLPSSRITKTPRAPTGIELNVTSKPPPAGFRSSFRATRMQSASGIGKVPQSPLRSNKLPYEHPRSFSIGARPTPFGGSGVLAASLASKQEASDRAIDSLQAANHSLLLELAAAKAALAQSAAKQEQALEHSKILDSVGVYKSDKSTPAEHTQLSRKAMLQPEAIRLESSRGVRSLLGIRGRSPVRGVVSTKLKRSQDSASVQKATGERTGLGGRNEPRGGSRRSSRSPAPRSASRSRSGSRSRPRTGSQAQTGQSARISAARLGTPAFEGSQDVGDSPMVIRPYLPPREQEEAKPVGELPDRGTVAHSHALGQMSLMLQRRTHAVKERARANWACLAKRVVLAHRQELVAVEQDSAPGASMAAIEWLSRKGGERGSRLRARAAVAGNAADAMELEARGLLGMQSLRQQASQENQPPVRAMVEAALPILGGMASGSMPHEDKVEALCTFLQVVTGGIR